MENTNDRNFQLQGDYTRYRDGFTSGYNSDNGPSHARNFKTLESAIRAAKKAFKDNALPKVVRLHEERDAHGRVTVFDVFAEDGHKFERGEKHAFWHVNGMRIVDRETQNVIWEQRAED